jgi:uncharacterized cofD-like protein
MKLVIIGGGTGLSTLARGLRRIGVTERHQVTAVVGMADSGGFSGFLRNEAGVLPPGDIMKLLLAFSTLPELAEKLLYYRFPDGSVPGHDILTARAKRNGFLNAVRDMEEYLQCSGSVLPASLDDANLCAETNRRIIEGEGNIEEWFYAQKVQDWDKEKLLGVYLHPSCRILPEARAAIEQADLVVIGPGSFYTSLIACLQVEGMTEALVGKNLACVVNVTTHPKETPYWRASDFVKELEQQIRRRVDVVVCNRGIPAELQQKYVEEHSSAVKVDLPPVWNRRHVITRQLVAPKSSFARHDPGRLARVIQELLE